LLTLCRKALKDRNKRRKYASAIAGASGIQENNKQKSRTESMIMDVDNDPELEQLKVTYNVSTLPY
jgi:hypothetical protein